MARKKLAARVPASAAAAPGFPVVEHVVRCVEPAAHRFGVASRFAGCEVSETVVRLPTWTPGSYMVRDFSRHLSEVRAHDDQGRALDCRKIRKNAWRVAHGGRPFTVAFNAFAFESTVRTAFLDDERGWFNGANLLLGVEGRPDVGATVVVELPEGWKIDTTMPRVRGAANTFAAADYDALMDHPFVLGPLKTIKFRAAGRTHRFTLNGVGVFPKRALVEAAQKSIAEAARLFGGLPYDDYAFLVNFVSDAEGQGGLEHRDSTLLQVPSRAMLDPAKVRAFVGLVAHEHFHLWNVKRIRDAALGPFDYEAEAYTELLWFHEGFTSYYDDLLPTRGGVFTAAEYLDILAESLNAFYATPGRRVQPLTEASFDAWIKFYKRNEETRSTTVSYYSHGALVALAMDLAIRAATKGRKSLDDVLRGLWRDSKRGGVLSNERWLDLALEATGCDLSRFHRMHVAGVAEPEFGEALATVGLALVPKDAADKKKPWLGLATRVENGRVIVEEALHGGPAAAAGVSAKDELVAVDGRRIGADLEASLRGLPAGGTIAFDVFRADRLRRLAVRVRPNPHPPIKLAPHPRATAADRRRFKAWCGLPFPDSIRKG